MYFTEDHIRSITRSYPINESREYSLERSRTSVFLSHKHSDRGLMLRIKEMFQHLGIEVYIDWLDEEMTAQTSGRTANILKKKIKQYDKFILVATNGAIASKWCNWELGLGDADKYEKDKISIMPIANSNNGSWDGNEYLQIYPTIEYEDGTSKYVNGKYIPEGYYVLYPEDEKHTRKVTLLKDWLLK